jgi:hypothetical protein
MGQIYSETTGDEPMQPCEQAANISNIHSTLARMEKSQEDIVDLLRIVSNQSPRIAALETQGERNYTEMTAMYDRMRDAEMNIASSGPTVRQEFRDSIERMDKKLDKLLQFYKATTSKPALYAYGFVVAMIVVGTICDLMYHFTAMKEIYHFVRG